MRLHESLLTSTNMLLLTFSVHILTQFFIILIGRGEAARTKEPLNLPKKESSLEYENSIKGLYWNKTELFFKVPSVYSQTTISGVYRLL